MHPLLAVIELAVWLGIPAVCLWLAMIAYSRMSRRGTQGARRSSLAWTLFVAFLVFLATWLWLTPAISLLAWAAWFGDNMPLSFRRLTPWLAAGVALVVAATVVVRGRRTESGDRYLRIRSVIAVTLLALLAAAGIYGWASKIYGSTPRAAAEEYLENVRGLPDPYRLVEERRWGPVKSGAPRWVSYRIVDSRGVNRGRVRVARYSRFWWTFASYAGFPPAGEALERAKELLGDWTRRDAAIRLLREITENHPETAEAEEAARLLEQAESGARQETPGRASRGASSRVLTASAQGS